MSGTEAPFAGRAPRNYQDGPFASELAPPRAPSQYEGMISAELRTMRNAIESIENAFGDHCARISPILGPESPQTGMANKEPAQLTASPLHDELDNLTRRLNGFRRQIEAISNRITL
jgi:hypothetical protein